MGKIGPSIMLQNNFVGSVCKERKKERENNLAIFGKKKHPLVGVNGLIHSSRKWDFQIVILTRLLKTLLNESNIFFSLCLDGNGPCGLFLNHENDYFDAFLNRVNFFLCKCNSFKLVLTNLN